MPDETQWLEPHHWKVVINPWADVYVSIPIKPVDIPVPVDPGPIPEPPFSVGVAEDPRPVPWIVDLQRLVAADAQVQRITDDETRSVLADAIQGFGKALLDRHLSGATLSFAPDSLR